MGDEQDREPALDPQGHDEIEDLFGGGRIELAGELVGQQERRVVRERDRDRDTLGLAPGELARAVARPVAQTDLLEQLLRPRIARRLRTEGHHRANVLARGQERDEVAVLEHNPDPSRPDPAPRGLVEPADVLAIDDDLPPRTGRRARRSATRALTTRFPRDPSGWSSCPARDRGPHREGRPSRSRLRDRS